LHPAAQAESLEAMLRDGGWNIHLAHGTREAQELASKHDFSVGLIRLEPSMATDDTLRSLLTGHRRMKWVAISDVATLRGSVLSRLVADNCFDSHTLPVDVNKLLFALDQAADMASMLRRQTSLKEAREFAERMAISASLEHTRSNVSRAARVLGVSRVTLYRLMEKHQIRS
jgi:DNA-binding NtrC family response regulator